MTGQIARIGWTDHKKTNHGQRRWTIRAAFISVSAIALLLCAPIAGADFQVAYELSYEQRPALVYNSVEDEHLAAWIDENGGILPAVMLQRLEPGTGAKIGPVAPVAGPSGMIGYAPTWKPTLAYSPITNQYVMAFNARFGLSYYENLLVIVAFDGSTLAEVDRQFLFLASDFADDWQNGNMIGLTYNELDDEFLVSYQRKILVGSETHEVISTQRYHIGTGLIGSETDLIGFDTNQIGSHSVAYSTFVASWNPPSPPVMGSTYLLATHANAGVTSDLSLFIVDSSGVAAQPIPFSSGIDDGAYYPSIATGRVAGMDHDQWLVTWTDYNNDCRVGNTVYIVGCEEGSGWPGIFGSFIDPWRTSYGSSADNTAFPISKIALFGYANGPVVAFSETDAAFHVTWQVVPKVDPENDLSLSHIRMNSVNLFIDSYPAPQPQDNFVVSDVTRDPENPCPPVPAECHSDQDPTYPAIATHAGIGATIVWEQKFPPNPTDHDIFGDIVQPVPEPGQLAMLLPGVVFVVVASQRRRPRAPASPAGIRFEEGGADRE